MLSSDVAVAPGTRQLRPIPWNQDGCHDIGLQAGEEVPAFNAELIRMAILRGSLVCGAVDRLSTTLNRELWLVGYVGKMHFSPVDHSLAVEVSTQR